VVLNARSEADGTRSTKSANILADNRTTKLNVKVKRMADFASNKNIDRRSAIQAHINLKKSILFYNYGIRGIVYDWFKSYLSNRLQYTAMQHLTSVV